MKAVTWKSAPAFLIEEPPRDWDIELLATIPAHTETGLTARETRRPLGDTVRLKLSWKSWLEGTDLTGFRNALQALEGDPVLCPLWLCPIESGDATPDVTAAYYALLGDGAASEIKAHAELPFSRPSFPLLVGRFDEIPDPELLHDEAALLDMEFVESGDESLGLPAFSAPAGVPGDANPLFPFRANWRSGPSSGGAEHEIDRQEMGELRSTADAYYDQPGRRKASFELTLQDLEPWQLLRFFRDRAGKSFWVPAGISDARLTANLLATDTALPVDQPAGRGDNAWFVLDDLLTRTPVKVTGTNGNNWTLSQAVGQAYAQGATRIESLMLAKWQKPQLKLTWKGFIAGADIDFTEVPWEVAAVSGETLGTTMGSLPLSAYLYKFWIEYPDGTSFWYFTDFERDLNYTAHTYLHKPIEHDSITQTATLERQKTNLSSRMWTGNPLGLLIPFRLEWPLMFSITEVDVSGGDAINARVLFVGEVQSAKNDGPFIKTIGKSLTSIYDRKIPRRLIQPNCNYTLFDTQCGLSPNTYWQWTGIVTAFNATTGVISLGSVARTLGSPITLTAHYFAGGYLGFGAAANAQRRLIGDSTAASGNALTLTIATPFSVNPVVDDVVAFHPGCDLTFGICINKFGNNAKFGGFPWMPVGNPSLVQVKKNTSGGGKK